VTRAPAGDPLLRPLRDLRGLDLHVVAGPALTTFALDYSGPRRRLTLRHAAAPLRPGDVPTRLREARVAYVGPVAGECDRALVESLGDGPFVCLGLQGWLRRAGPDGAVLPSRAPEIDAPPQNARAAVLSEEDHPDAESIARALALRNTVVALTRGRRGSRLFYGNAESSVPAAPAQEVDPTGAGDVFGLILALALAGGASPATAGALAAEASARVVEGPGLGRLAEFDPKRLPPL
jgi:1D-myo-inositol 3-kinase